ncbi:hypothetical protein SAMN02745163_03690 [Clostridium cavendishii DSM 21758]|uniref:DUF3796 domain-containing protein n=1 Tax=Clostridium cavendishii DSM 21758 TaxID=1121302 RepID=A0A1M6RWM9_9CLOT|nr:hypothetical protein [Clostridium cavendishii]SHK36863.1 hypothetical protein SAMN02745163_03690 [Clostridium cavendishii DSM 21758]
MDFNKHKYIGFLGLLSLIGLKGFNGGSHLWLIFFLNYGWFTFFYENSYVYKRKLAKVSNKV